MIWHESGGTGARTVLFLHGLGATAAVWNGVRQVLQERGDLRWVSADLSGHGGSDWHEVYSVGQLAAELAGLVRERSGIFIIGHSLGTYVGLALASGWFGVEVRGVVGIGPKITWQPAELQTARELAARPMRWYPTEDEALTRYRRVSGLDAAIAPETQWLSRGVIRQENGWRLAQDARTFAVAGAPFATLAACATSRIILARGQNDTMVSLAQLRSHAAETHDIAGAGHNVHVEKPAEIVRLLERLFADPSPGQKPPAAPSEESHDG